MICKKCGANIADTSKFCGYCGNQIEAENQVVNNVNEDSLQNVNMNDTLTNNVDLGKTIQIEPQQPVVNVQPLQEQPVNPNLQAQQVVGQPIPTQNPAPKKKNNKLILLIGGIVLAVAAIVLVIFLIAKPKGVSIDVLEKAINNLNEKATESVTVNGKLTLGASTGESFDIKVSSKVQKVNDKYNMELALEKSMFFDEMKLYSTVSKDEVSLYAKSSLIDMLGSTSSLEDKWIYYTLNLSELGVSLDQNVEVEQTLSNIKLSDFIDKEHFIYVDKKDGLNHYQLIIDQKLINDIASKAASLSGEDIDETFDMTEELPQTIKIDLYINSSEELAKIEFNMSEFLTDVDGISKFIFTLEFTGLNSTVVQIPREALTSEIDLETYMSSNSTITNDYDIDYDYGYEVDFNDTLFQY